MRATKGEVTRLLLAWSEGDGTALDRLMPLVFEELRRLAGRRLGGESSRHTLQPTALVNEVYLRLVELRKVHWQDRARFFAFSAELMRRILVDHARALQTAKRGSGDRPVSIETVGDLPERQEIEVLQVDELLTDLAREDKRLAEIVKLRFFAGLTEEEIAEVLGISVSTVKRGWTMARLWLFRELTERGEGAP
jgi:RNA polymerase sigma factor (TIGR02999 family)